MIGQSLQFLRSEFPGPLVWWLVPPILDLGITGVECHVGQRKEARLDREKDHTSVQPCASASWWGTIEMIPEAPAQLDALLNDCRPRGSCDGRTSGQSRVAGSSLGAPVHHCLSFQVTPLTSHVSDHLTELVPAHSLESLGLDVGKLLPKFVTDGGGDKYSATGVPAPFKDCS